jgi:hypothetical protein
MGIWFSVAFGLCFKTQERYRINLCMRDFLSGNPLSRHCGLSNVEIFYPETVTKLYYSYDRIYLVRQEEEE